MRVTVIKVGGSLQKSKKLNELCIQLGRIGENHRILIVPGGGIFADAVRACEREFNLGQDNAHWMAILAMNQYGYLLSSLIPESVCTEDITEAHRCADSFKPVVFLPYRFFKDKDPLPHSWDVTSDSIAAWIAGYLEAERLVLVKSTFISAEGEKNHDYRLPVDIERLKETDIVDPMFYTIMKEIKMRSENHPLSLFPRRRESKNQTGSWISTFAGMTIKSHKTIPGQLREIGLWIINGNFTEKLTGLFEYFKIG